MKAPEKIYLQEDTTTDCYDDWWSEWFEERAKDSDIEYTRTDSFIEKACEWLRCNYLKYPSEDCADTTKFVMDFNKYMKGE